MRRTDCLAFIALCAGLASFPASRVEAYCRTTTCTGCARDASTGCVIDGTPLAWPSSCVSFSMGEQGSAAVDAETAARLMAEAFAIWSAAPCDRQGNLPSIEVGISAPALVCEDVGYSTRGGNANAVIFRDDAWPYADAYRGLASTTVTSRADGSIVDADIEINTTLPIFITGQTTTKTPVGAHDLLSIMVHEAGHFLGLDHSRTDNAIMRPSLDPGAVSTVLSSDDIAAICAAYPPTREATCDAAPGAGFSAECAPDASDSGCSVLPGAAPHAGVGSLAWTAVVLWLGRRRRRTDAGARSA
jgi:hypothetical protein